MKRMTPRDFREIHGANVEIIDMGPSFFQRSFKALPARWPLWMRAGILVPVMLGLGVVMLAMVGLLLLTVGTALSAIFAG